MKIGIDLLWLRPGKNGGTESYIRNLITGFATYDDRNEYTLFVSRDNADSFNSYTRINPGIRLEICPIDSSNRIRRIAWENLNLDNLAKKTGVDVMFIPVYSMPHKKRSNGIPYVVTIHDLQGLHYPEYFTKIRLGFLKRKWKYASEEADRIVAISNFTKRDIVENYKAASDKVITIYNPVITGESAPISELSKWGLKAEDYYYCVSSLLPHKNLYTLIDTFAYRKKKGHEEILVISGVGGESVAKAELVKKIESLGIKDNIRFTGFVSDAERNLLYQNCRAFLFPSVFEGFGMPPVEVLMIGRPTVTTEKTSIKEVTCSKAIYVKDPFDIKEWSDAIDRAVSEDREFGLSGESDRFKLEKITREYLEIFESFSQSTDADRS
ncbi:MAG: Mannosylfructose-phosphate synthase [Firmicutes bacterium ADurb.Bin354]|nr:MAG: Mannosylfructose-phosphate synthase [Firmicutes bacterium ADurb.Bin354]